MAGARLADRHAVRLRHKTCWGDVLAAKFRFYEKKRGNRRTGSRALGSLGEVVFFAALFLLGCGGLVVLLATLVVPEYRANHVFVETPCVVRDKELGRKDTAEGPRFRPEIRIEYQVQGETYVVRTYDIRQAYSASQEAAQAVLDRFVVGQQYPCWYDPDDPRVAVLARGYSWWFWLTFLVPVSFIVTGGAGLVYAAWTWGKSAERRAAPGTRLSPLPRGPGRPKSHSEYPSVPTPANITNSPGTELAFRLPLEGSPSFRLVVWLVVALGWNGIVSIFAAWAIGEHVAGRPDWVLTGFTIPFALGGVGLIVFFFRQLVLATWIGPTLVEVSDQPLRPGRRYEVFLSQTGRLRVNSLQVLFVCEEEATYRHGTNTRTETCRVFQQPVFRKEDFQLVHGVPFEARFSLEVPAAAMHSFHSDNNEINWKLIVVGDVAGWPSFERSFPVIVYPPGDGSPLAASSAVGSGNVGKLPR